MVVKIIVFKFKRYMLYLRNKTGKLKVIGLKLDKSEVREFKDRQMTYCWYGKALKLGKMRLTLFVEGYKTSFDFGFSYYDSSKTIKAKESELEEAK